MVHDDPGVGCQNKDWQTRIAERIGVGCPAEGLEGIQFASENCHTDCLFLPLASCWHLLSKTGGARVMECEVQRQHTWTDLDEDEIEIAIEDEGEGVGGEASGEQKVATAGLDVSDQSQIRGCLDSRRLINYPCWVWRR